MSGVWVVLEERDGRISRFSWEAIAAAQRLATQVGQPVSAVLPGVQTEALATEAATRALTRVVRLEHPLLAPYTPDGFCIALQQLFEKERPTQVVFPHSYQVRDYAPALAARFGQVLIGDVTAISDGPVFLRQLMQGRLTGEYRPAGSGASFLSVQSGAFRADQVEAGAATVEIFTPNLSPEQIRTRPGQPFRTAAQTVDLGSAALIVSVGRGIKEAENLPLVQDLAASLGAELAASRAVVTRQYSAAAPARAAKIVGTA